jgi:antitoxin HigA-1
MGLSVYAVAKAIGMPRSRINDIANGMQGITAPIALRPSKYFGVDPQWFMSMQNRYDLRMAEKFVDLSTIETLRTAA